MTLSPATLRLLQQAGQGLYSAQQAVSADVQAFGARVLALTASQPFDPDNDSAYKQLRSLARMAHELQAMEEQLKALYAQAGDAVRPELGLLVALPHNSNASSASGPGARRPDKGSAQEAVVKSAGSAAKTAKKARPGPKPAQAKAPRPARPSANDEKVLAHLKSVLERDSFKPLTHANIAQAAKMPVGSVGIALRRLAAAGLVNESKGSYRLGSAEPAETRP